MLLGRSFFPWQSTAPVFVHTYSGNFYIFYRQNFFHHSVTFTDGCAVVNAELRVEFSKATMLYEMIAVVRISCPFPPFSPPRAILRKKKRAITTITSSHLPSSLFSSLTQLFISYKGPSRQHRRSQRVINNFPLFISIHHQQTPPPSSTPLLTKPNPPLLLLLPLESPEPPAPSCSPTAA